MTRYKISEWEAFRSQPLRSQKLSLARKMKEPNQIFRLSRRNTSILTDSMRSEEIMSIAVCLLCFHKIITK